MSRPPLSVAACLALAACLASACSGEPEPPPAPAAVEEPPPRALEPAQAYRVVSGTIEPDDTIGTALGRLGVDLARANELVAALDGVFDFRRANVGDSFQLTTAGGQVQFFDYRRGPVEEYLVRREGDRLVGSAREFDIERKVVQVSGRLDSSLWEAITGAGESPQVAVALADVLAWDVDFMLDPRKGDTFQIVIEKFLHDGKTVRYGDVLAAEYDGQLVGDIRVFRYPNPKTGNLDYYAPDGSSARRAFLKSPLKFTFVTSSYGSRYHPVLKYRKSHKGVDLRASIGTPVWAVGDGTVTSAGWVGACGKMIKLRHANGLETIYCHLSSIARGIHVGARVAQKDVIGYTGKTGRVTGPHLHYGVKKYGRYINPLTLKLPPADPLPESEMSKFTAAIQPLVDRLGGTKVATAPHDVATVGP